MIREGHKLPENVIDRIPVLIEQIGKDKDVVALYAFGSLATGDLKPLISLRVMKEDQIKMQSDFSISPKDRWQKSKLRFK